jgi:hypothetical protein
MDAIYPFTGNQMSAMQSRGMTEPLTAQRLGINCHNPPCIDFLATNSGLHQITTLTESLILEQLPLFGLRPRQANLLPRHSKTWQLI